MASILEKTLTSEGLNGIDEVFDPELVGDDFNYLSGEQIDYGEIPTKDQWCLMPLRKVSQTGGTLIWQIGFDPIKNQLVRRRGYERTPLGVPGAITDDTVQIEQNQSGRNIQEQALLQAKKLFMDKTREGYNYSGVLEKSHNLISAQLACTYRPPNTKGAKKGNERSITESDLKRCPVSCQVKLDGQRCRSYRNSEGEIVLLSRSNREIDHLEHIREELAIFFMYLPSECGLDGELYKEGFFEDLSSAIRTVKTKHEDNEKVKYHIFDLILPETTLEDRIKILFGAYQKYREDDNVETTFHLITHTNAHTHKQIDELLGQALVAGYEGLIIRYFSGENPTKRQLERSWYKGSRNTNLLKYKNFTDDEGEIIDIIEGKDRHKGWAIMVLKDSRGQTFNCNAHGKEDVRKYIFNHKEDYIGKMYTYKYFELTAYGMPRFPVGIRFRDYE